MENSSQRQAPVMASLSVALTLVPFEAQPLCSHALYLFVELTRESVMTDRKSPGRPNLLAGHKERAFALSRHNLGDMHHALPIFGFADVRWEITINASPKSTSLDLD
jgi:hypothetical protein